MRRYFHFVVFVLNDYICVLIRQCGFDYTGACTGGKPIRYVFVDATVISLGAVCF